MKIPYVILLIDTNYVNLDFFIKNKTKQNKKKGGVGSAEKWWNNGQSIKVSLWVLVFFCYMMWLTSSKPWL